MKNKVLLALSTVACLGACSIHNKSDEASDASGNSAALVSAASTNQVGPIGNEAAPAPAAAPASPAIAGFDPAAVPMGTSPTGGWPYFGLIDGYERMTRENSPGYESKKWLKDVDYDRYEFFDGVKIIPVEGRLFTTQGMGKGASFFQIQKTYEKFIHDLGGVTVYEGTGQALEDHKVMFSEKRMRANYVFQDDKMGVYMARTPAGQIWVEVYHPWEDNSENYWLTIVQTKAFDSRAKVLQADELKKDLDAAGHVALYVNFDTDKTAVKPDSAPILAQVAKLLQDNPTLKLTVEGHTDNAGTPAHNQMLSEGRANAVVGALMAQGIGADRLQAKGFGQTKPIADNGNEDGRAKNRRVELVKR